MTALQYKYIHEEREKRETDSVKCIKKPRREKASTVLHAEKRKVRDRRREQEARERQEKRDSRERRGGSKKRGLARRSGCKQQRCEGWH